MILSSLDDAPDPNASREIKEGLSFEILIQLGARVCFEEVH